METRRSAGKDEKSKGWRMYIETTSTVSASMRFEARRKSINRWEKFIDQLFGEGFSVVDQNELLLQLIFVFANYCRYEDLKLLVLQHLESAEALLPINEQSASQVSFLNYQSAGSSIRIDFNRRSINKGHN